MPGMEIKVFSDFIDALEKAGSLLKDVAKLPSEQRSRYRQVLGDTYQLIDASLVMIIVRLGNALGRNGDDDFLNDVVSLDNYAEWLQARTSFPALR